MAPGLRGSIMLHAAETWVQDQMLRAAAEDITLRRGPSVTEEITCIAWDREAESVDRDGVTQVIRYREFVIKKDRYKIEGEPVKPRRGDRYADASSETWEVLPVPGKPEAETYGPDAWIIRTKRVDRA